MLISGNSTVRLSALTHGTSSRSKTNSTRSGCIQENRQSLHYWGLIRPVDFTLYMTAASVQCRFVRRENLCDLCSMLTAHLMGELEYLWGNVIGTDNARTVRISHGWNPLGKSAWRRRPETEPNVIWLHRDEAPEGLLNAVDGELPCVIADHGHRVEMLLDNEALKACEGDFATFTALLEEKLRALHSMQAPAAHNHPSG